MTKKDTQIHHIVSALLDRLEEIDPIYYSSDLVAEADDLLKELETGAMQAEELKALKTTINYLWRDEKKHFFESEKADRTSHIFSSLKILKNWIKLQKPYS